MVKMLLQDPLRISRLLIILCLQGVQGLHYFDPDISSRDHE